MRNLVFVALVGVAGALLTTTPADMAASRSAACLERECRPAANACFARETSACANVRACVEPCAEGDTTCIEGCLWQVDASCAACMKQMLDCGRTHCPDEVVP